jgi:ABC-2 type transport system ATP-binding protein
MFSGQKDAIISITNLTKVFGNLTAVDHLSFEVVKGEIFGFLGPNGAGKTTTINMMCGLLPCTEGKIDFFTGKENDEVKSVIGYCPQDNIFYPKLTCLEQLIFMGNLYGFSNIESKKKGNELLTMLGLIEKSGTFARNLSGGMKRRLNICLALIHDPEILILDEPEAGLDPQSKILVRNFIKCFAKNKTVILTSHNMDEVERLADRVAIIDYGKLLIIDTPDNLKKTIGEGDILELEMEEADETKINKLAPYLADYDVKRSDNSLIIKSIGLIDKIPQIIETIKEKGLLLKEIKLRENTLEDVFIHLTGRKLRQ